MARSDWMAKAIETSCWQRSFSAGFEPDLKMEHFNHSSSTYGPSQSVLMVNVVKWGNKSLSVWCIDWESWVITVVLLAQPAYMYQDALQPVSWCSFPRHFPNMPSMWFWAFQACVQKGIWNTLSHVIVIKVEKRKYVKVLIYIILHMYTFYCFFYRVVLCNTHSLSSIGS